MYDLIVIGGGPGGCSAAITVARGGANVLLLERGRLPRNKVCGEFVSAESLDLLAWLLDTQGPDLLERAYRVPEVRFFSDGLVIGSPLNPPGASISRFELDFALWEAAKHCGVDAQQQVAVEAISGEGPFRILTRAGEFEGRAVLKACGRWSNLNARTLDRCNGRRNWLGVKAHFAEQGRPQSVDLYFFNGGYCGVQPVSLRGHGEESRINVCAQVRAEVASTLSDVFEQHPVLRERSRNWQQLMEPVSTAPLIFCKPQPVEKNILLAGDAAGFVDPFVGDGISLALRSGALGGRSLKPFLAGTISLEEAARSYRRAYERELSSIFSMSSKVRQLFFLLPRAFRVMTLSAIKRSPALVQLLVRHTR
jgi:flavin-dependent dehydrogenase